MAWVVVVVDHSAQLYYLLCEVLAPGKLLASPKETVVADPPPKH